MPLILPNTIANQTPADGDRLQQNFATIEDWANQNAVTSDGSVAMTGQLLLPGNPTQPNQAATKGYVDGTVPIGSVTMYAGQTEPSASWMFCRGQSLSRANFATLFSIIGIQFGQGDAPGTTFALPDYQGVVPVGVNKKGTGIFVSGAVGERAGSPDGVIPPHTHPINVFTGVETANHFHTSPVPGSQFAVQDPTGGTFSFSTVPGPGKQPTLVASTSNEVQTHQHAINNNTDNATGAVTSLVNTNLQPSMTINFLIKVSA